MWLTAHSISHSLQTRLSTEQGAALVLAVFARVCNLVTPDDDVIALVLPQVGDGPLNIVVEGSQGAFAELAPKMPVRLGEGWLQVGALRVDWHRARLWNPRPDWTALRAQRAVILARLPHVRDFAPQSLLALLQTRVPAAGWDGLVLSAARQALRALREGWAGDGERLRQGATALAGLGGGLTPAGDDFLVGVTLAAWLLHPTPETFCAALAQAAAPCTTTLSAAFLRAAARGECGQAWHSLLAALSTEKARRTEMVCREIRQIQSQGATSGADSLAGFLWSVGAQHAAPYTIQEG